MKRRVNAERKSMIGVLSSPCNGPVLPEPLHNGGHITFEAAGNEKIQELDDAIRVVFEVVPCIFRDQHKRTE